MNTLSEIVQKNIYIANKHWLVEICFVSIIDRYH